MCSKPDNVVAETRQPAPGVRGDGSRLGRGRLAGWLAWSFTLALVIVFAVVVAVGKNRRPPPLETPERALVNVETRRVTAAEHYESLILPAMIAADRDAAISSELNGTLAEWLIDEGGDVSEGEPVAVLDKEQLEAGLAQLAAQLDSAQASRDYAEKEHRRIELLAKAEIATEADLDAAVNRLTLSRLAITQVEREIASVRVTVAKTVMRAPISGRLEEHLIETGEVVASGQELARLYDLRHVRATVDVPDRYIPFLEQHNAALQDFIAGSMPGAEQALRVKLILPGLPKLTGGTYQGIELDAAVDRVAQAADLASNTFKVELRLPNPAGALRQGMIAQGRIDYLRYSAALLIPLQAVHVADVGPRVLVVEEQDGETRAFVRDIEPISISGDQLLVGAGLADGDRLVVAGGKGVMNGERVNVIMRDGVLQNNGE